MINLIYKVTIIIFSVSVLNCTPDIYLSSNKFEYKYFNLVDDGYNLSKTWYHYSVETNGLDYIYKQYFPTTMQITHKYHYSDSKRLNKNGSAEEWYDNGNRMFKGNYRNNLKDGDWKYFSYSTNKLFQFGKYNKGSKEGIWTTVDSTATVRATHMYLNDKKHGSFKYFDEEGKLFREGIYENDELNYDTTYTNKTPYHFKVVDKMPVLIDCPNFPNEQRMKCKEGTLTSSLRINYPEFERRMGIEGKAIIQFVVNKEGGVENLNITRGLSEGIKRSILNSFPKESIWEPANDDGKTVKVLYSLPINFKLSN